MKDYFRWLEKLPLKQDLHYLRRYCNFMVLRLGRSKFSGSVKHHILPKAKGFFPEFRLEAWNVVYLSNREHYVAHSILARAFPNSAMSLAFYLMSNILDRKHSRTYEAARRFHGEQVRRMTQDPRRNAKISRALSGVPKSEAHKEKLRGKRPEWHGETISKGMFKSDKRFWKEDVNRVALHSASRKGKPTHPWTETQREEMAKMKTGIPCSAETRDRMSRSRQGRKWYTNGVRNTWAVESPDSSWRLGRTKL